MHQGWTQAHCVEGPDTLRGRGRFITHTHSNGSGQQLTRIEDNGRGILRGFPFLKHTLHCDPHKLEVKGQCHTHLLPRVNLSSPE